MCFVILVLCIKEKYVVSVYICLFIYLKNFFDGRDCSKTRTCHSNVQKRNSLKSFFFIQQNRQILQYF